MKYLGNELYHHGVKGQTWGNRRYQNEDGSLTTEGRVHYGYSDQNGIYANKKRPNAIRGTVKTIKASSYTKNDPDFDNENYSEKNRVGDTDFFSFTKPDGTKVILEEDTKWTLPANANVEEEVKKLQKKFEDDKNENLDKIAQDVIAGKYGNGEERKKKLGPMYSEVQKIVNAKLSAKHSEIYYGNELYHFGIPDMKWGQRRYQNSDGTYTELGKERRRKSEITKRRVGKAFNPSIKVGKGRDNITPAEKIGRTTEDAINTSKRIVDRYNRPKLKEDISKMSDEDLRKKIDRLQLESRYEDLSLENTKTGLDYVSEFLDTFGDIVNIASSMAIIYAVINQIK